MGGIDVPPADVLPTVLNARDVATERRDLVPSVERLRDDSTADSARGTDNSDLHDSPVRAKKWPNSYRAGLYQRAGLIGEAHKGRLRYGTAKRVPMGNSP